MEVIIVPLIIKLSGNYIKTVKSMMPSKVISNTLIIGGGLRTVRTT